MGSGDQSDASGTTPSIGAYLARQRAIRGIDLDELALRTRVPRRSLERLEAGAFDGSADGFTRGFVRTVARSLGLDPDETLARLRPEPGGAGERPERGRSRALVFLLGLALIGSILARVALRGDAAEPGEPEAPDHALAPTEPAPAPSAGVRLRRDAVRELARELGVLGPAQAKPVGAAPAPAERAP